MINAKEGAKILGISLPIFYELCKRPDFPAVRFGRAIRIDESALIDWFSSHHGENVLGGAGE